MKMKSLFSALFGAMCLMAPMSIQAAAAPATEHLYASVDGFNQIKANLNTTLKSLKAAQSGTQVSEIMYQYVKNMLTNDKVYGELTEYQRKQIDTLQKQVGIVSQKKIAQFNCKKEVDQAVQKATLEMLSKMK